MIKQLDTPVAPTADVRYSNYINPYTHYLKKIIGTPDSFYLPNDNFFVILYNMCSKASDWELNYRVSLDRISKHLRYRKGNSLLQVGKSTKNVLFFNGEHEFWNYHDGDIIANYKFIVNDSMGETLNVGVDPSEALRPIKLIYHPYSDLSFKILGDKTGVPETKKEETAVYWDFDLTQFITAVFLYRKRALLYDYEPTPNEFIISYVLKPLFIDYADISMFNLYHQVGGNIHRHITKDFRDKRYLPLYLKLNILLKGMEMRNKMPAKQTYEVIISRPPTLHPSVTRSIVRDPDTSYNTLPFKLLSRLEYLIVLTRAIRKTEEKSTISALKTRLRMIEHAGWIRAYLSRSDKDFINERLKVLNKLI